MLIQRKFLRDDFIGYIEVDITIPLKMEIKYKSGNAFKPTLLIIKKNLTDICYACAQQHHKFKSCSLFPKSFSIKLEKSLDVLLKKINQSKVKANWRSKFRRIG